jgi:hypothetical protein
MKTYLSLLFVFGIFSAVVVGLPTDAHAHGEAGITFTSTTTEGYIVDVDYADVYIQADSMGRFVFNLFADGSRKKEVNFTDMWVRIEKKDGEKSSKTVFAGPIAKQEFGGNGFSYIFAEGGTYTLSVRFNDASSETFGKTAGEGEFELTVLRNPDKDKFSFGMEFWVGLVGGLFLALLGLLPLLLGKKTS